MGSAKGSTEGSGRGMRRRRPPSAVSIAVDCAVSLFLLSPLCVLYWRGTWQLLDFYMFKGRLDLSGLSSVILGYCICWFCYAIQDVLNVLILDTKISLWWRGLVSRAYTVLFAFGLVNLWRGVWQLLDNFFGRSWESGAGSAAVGLVALASMRALRNIMAPPLGLSTDHFDKAYTYCPTIFRTREANKSLRLFLLDVTFSVVIVGSLVVFVWRGLWTVFDVFIFPDAKDLSAWSSLGIGYVVVVLAYAAQRPVSAVSARLESKLRRIVLEDAYIAFASVGAINVWRGVWVFADVYIVPDDYVLSNALTSVIGMLGSILLFAGNNILARGVYLDGEFDDGSGCTVSGPYLRKFIKRQVGGGEVGTRLEAVTCLPVTSDRKINGDAWRENNPVKDGFGMMRNDASKLLEGSTTAPEEVEIVTEKETVL